MATAVGSVAGYVAGLSWGDRQPPVQTASVSLFTCAPGCCGLLAGSSAGALLGAGIGWLVDGDLDPIAVPAAAFAAPAGAAAGWFALSYAGALFVPPEYAVEGFDDVRTGNPLAVVGVLTGTGLGTALSTFAVTSLRYRPVPVPPTPPAALPPSSSVPAPPAAPPLEPAADPAEAAHENGASRAEPETPSSLPSVLPSSPIVD